MAKTSRRSKNLISELDRPDRVTAGYSAGPGLSQQVVLEISRQKNEPRWMLEKRLQALELYQHTPLPAWGPDLARLDLEHIVYYSRPDATEAQNWKDVPSDIRRTFDLLGIPEAEHHALSGAGAQYDSGVIYHRLKKEWGRQGVIFENLDVAVRKYPELVRRYFMTDCVPVSNHKFTMLHAAVWSGGTFIYVPPRVKVTRPLQAYFRMNLERGGQFEHTLIIADEGSEVEYIEGCSAPRYAASSLHAGCVELHLKAGARVKYSSVENWSKNTYNLNTKRAVVDRDASIEWLSGNLGSGVTMLYPASVLRGDRARSDSLSVAFAGPGQELDTGFKAVHAAPGTMSVSRSKSLCRGGGTTVYRGLVRVTAAARDSKAAVTCDSLLLDRRSTAKAYPRVRVDNNSSEAVHEATVGRIGEEEIFYLRSRGLSEERARKMIVGGFVEPLVKRLPLEYAVEMNKLIELEMDRKVA
ncbi:MAG: Fe-S cluster assembly protein SufB [Patescibacteria group bacterium]|jgi:Fe-S cluster assembly protein SufB